MQQRRTGSAQGSTPGGDDANATGGESTFLTGVAPNQVIEELKITEDDVIPSEPWKAHDDGINCVTYIPELQLIATCSFDYHVYVWNAEGESRQRVGSLLLGNKVLPPGVKPDAEQRRYKNQWKI